MAKLYNISNTQIIPQSDFSAQQNENGGWTASQSFIIKKGGIDLASIRKKFAAGIKLTELDPNADIYYDFLRLMNIGDVSTVEGGYTRVLVEFVGFWSATYEFETGEDIPSPTFSKRGVLSETSFSEHPKFKALTDAEKNSLGKLMSGEWSYVIDPFGAGTYVVAVFTGDAQYSIRPDADQITSENGIQFAKRIAEGRTTYKKAVYEYTHRWEASKGVTSAQMNDLGKISTPTGSPPKPGTGRNWMLVGVNEEQYGSGDFRFHNELVYLLSDEGGHDDFLQS